jgi:hypothetical protein
MLASWIAGEADLGLSGLAGWVLGPGAVPLRFLPDQREEPEPRLPDPRRAALLALVLTLLLVLVGVLLVRVLARAGRLQDCVMSGRTNCAPIDLPASGSR